MTTGLAGESRTEKVPVTIRSGPDRPISGGAVEVVTWSAKDRSRRALRFLGLCWGIGLFCVILPLVHFVLVPGLFIAGLVGFARLSGQSSLILGGEGNCPECKRTFRIAKATHRFPMDELCEHCKASVSVDRAATA